MPVLPAWTSFVFCDSESPNHSRVFGIRRSCLLTQVEGVLVVQVEGGLDVGDVVKEELAHLVVVGAQVEVVQGHRGRGRGGDKRESCGESWVVER